MVSRPPIITDEIRDDILFRSSMATSRDHITRAIFDALVKAGVDWRTVPLDEVKVVLLEASRGFKRRMAGYAPQLARRSA